MCGCALVPGLSVCVGPGGKDEVWVGLLRGGENLSVGDIVLFDDYL